MTIGVAIVVVAAMYFIDKHNLWRRFAMCLGIAAVVALLGLGGFWGWKEYRDARNKKALAESDKKWAAEVPACNNRNIKNYFAAEAASSPTPPPGFVLNQAVPESVMEEIKKSCSADPYKYVWSTWPRVLGEECLDGTESPCTLMSDGHGNLVPIPKEKATTQASAPDGKQGRKHE
jgi:hypothetical protein